MNYLLKLTVFLSLIIVFSSCDNDDETSSLDSKQKFELNYERLENVHDLVSQCEVEFMAAVFNSKTEDGINQDLFEQELKERFQTSVELKQAMSLKSVQKESDLIDVTPYFNTLLNLIENHEVEGSSADKDACLASFSNIFDCYIDEVIENEHLTGNDKQYIIENLTLKYGLIQIQLIYGDEFAIGGIDMKKRCNWWCKNRKKITCTGLSMLAAGTCGGAVGSGGSLTYVCVASLTVAARCWSSI